MQMRISFFFQLEMNLQIMLSVNNKFLYKSHRSFPEPNVTNYNLLFCRTNSPTPQIFQSVIMKY